MAESDAEARLGTVMEEIRDALVGIEGQLKEINEKLSTFEECVETRTPLRILRVADVNAK